LHYFWTSAIAVRNRINEWNAELCTVSVASKLDTDTESALDIGSRFKASKNTKRTCHDIFLPSFLSPSLHPVVKAVLLSRLTCRRGYLVITCAERCRSRRLCGLPWPRRRGSPEWLSEAELWALVFKEINIAQVCKRGWGGVPGVRRKENKYRRRRWKRSRL
jgi:hypothetical protein